MRWNELVAWESSTATNRTIVVAPDHPAIAGHFPGCPIVPGVLILTEVMGVLRETLGDDFAIVGLPAVKFLSPLKPGEALDIHAVHAGHGILAFTCKSGGRPVAKGKLAYRPSTA